MPTPREDRADPQRAPRRTARSGGNDERAVQVSVIVPCHNCTDTIGDQLAALAAQDFGGSWEVVLVDNGSDDDLEGAVRPFAAPLPRLRVIRADEQQNAGYARNVGARNAEGELLLFTDADDVVGDGWLAAMTEALREHPFVAARLERERLNDPEVVRTRGTSQSDGLSLYKHPPFLPHASGSTLGVRREVHEAIGGFCDLKNLQDTDYCWRVQLAGYDLTFVPDAVVHYRYRDSAEGVFRQAVAYGFYNVVLYVRFRPRGMPRANWRRGARKWLNLIQKTPQLRHPGKRLSVLRDFGFRVGRLAGCLRYGVAAL